MKVQMAMIQYINRGLSSFLKRLLYDAQPAFSQKKLTLIFGRYTGIQVYENADTFGRNNQFIFHWEGSDAR